MARGRKATGKVQPARSSIDRDEAVPIITFTADRRHYVPASMKRLLDGEVHYTKVKIPPGQSRYGGPVIDLPKDFRHPRGMRFAAQLDLSRFAPFDKAGLLPKQGQLLFFADIMKDRGTVVYVDVPNDSLVRAVVEHDDNFYSGVLVDTIAAGSERLAERFDEGEWDSFAGSEVSKLFGIPVHCQWEQKDVEAMLRAGKVVLLQVGENGFNDEGVFSVFIGKKDLEKRDFSKCEFAWGQS